MPERKKVVMKVNELQDVDVSFISLVQNAANRSPFKIIKSAEEDVNIDLKKLFTIKKTEDEPAVALASVIVKTGALPAATARLLELGISVVKESEEDGVTTLQLVEELPEDMVLIKLDDNAAVLVSGIQKMFAEWPEGNDFATNMTQAGFYPSLHLATDVMISTIHNVMESVEKGESPRASVQDTLGQYSDYILKMVDAIPVTAYKFEGLELTKEETIDEPEVKTDTTDDLEIDPEAGGEGEVQKTEGDDTAEGKPPVEINIDAIVDAVVSRVGDKLSGVTKSVEELTETVNTSDEKVTKSLEEVNERLVKTEDGLRGVVSTSGGEGDNTSVKKDDEPEKAVFDDVLKFDGLENPQS